MVVSDAAISSSSEHLKKIPNIRTLPLFSNNWYTYVFILFNGHIKKLKILSTYYKKDKEVYKKLNGVWLIR